MIHCDKCKKVFTRGDGGYASARAQARYREADEAQALTDMAAIHDMPELHDLCSDCWDLLVDVDLLKLWLDAGAEGHERMSDEALADLKNKVAGVFYEFANVTHVSISAPISDYANAVLRVVLPNDERLR